MKHEYIGDQSITIHGNGEEGTHMSEIELPEPAAWLVTDGRTYHDKAFLSEEQAKRSIDDRKDGARLADLYTAEQVRAAIFAERERCARVAERTTEFKAYAHGNTIADEIAAAIRRGPV